MLFIILPIIENKNMVLCVIEHRGEEVGYNYKDFCSGEKQITV